MGRKSNPKSTRRWLEGVSDVATRQNCRDPPGKRKRAAPEEVVTAPEDGQDDETFAEQSSAHLKPSIARGQLLRLKHAKPPVVSAQFGTQCAPQHIINMFHDLVKSKDAPIPPAYR